MKKKDELKLTRSGLNARAAKHRKWSDWWGGSFLLGVVLLVGGGALGFLFPSSHVAWVGVAALGCVLAVWGMICGVTQLDRARELEVLASKKPVEKPMDPRGIDAALDLLEKDKDLDDDKFTPPAALGPARGLTDEGWEDLKDQW